MNKLFVYGIFLDGVTSKAYGMSNPRYTTVLDYATYGDRIVMAFHVPDERLEQTGRYLGEGRLSLTGLLVDVDPAYWDELDRLEAGYTRQLVTTSAGISAYMYIGGTKDGAIGQRHN